MKNIFICKFEDKFRTVYAEHYDVLVARKDFDEHLYSRDEIVEKDIVFHDTENIFSTWGMPHFSEAEIRHHFPALKAVYYAAGTVQAFAREFLACGVRVHSAWAANAVPVAEYTLAEIVLANKGVFAHMREMKERNLEKCNLFKENYLGNYGEKVGLLGIGMIGTMVAKRLRDYRLEVLAFDPFLSDERAEELHVKKCSLDEIFSSCRVISNHMANNGQTKGMLTYRYFSKMLPYATFLNTGRGAQVVEDDLVRALTERPDLTAILDVTEPEPSPEGHPFYTLPNCFLTPHIAGSLCNETHRMAEYTIEEYERSESGLPTKYEVTVKMLETMA